MIYTDTVTRAISELHRIEMSIFNLWKQLPDVDIANKVKQVDYSNYDVSDFTEPVTPNSLITPWNGGPGNN